MAQPVVLKFASFEPPTAPFTSRVFVPWAEEVSKASNGAIKIEVFAGGVLGRNPLQQFKMMQDGVADLVWTAAGYTPGRFDDTEVIELPFLFQSAREGSLALTRLVAKNELVGFADLKMLLIGTVSPVSIHAKFPLKTLADLKGKRLRSGSSMMGNVIEAMGGVPVLIGAPNSADALSKGVIDGALAEWNFVATFKTDEVTQHHLALPLGGTAIMVPMTKSRFESLPAAGRAALEKLGGEAFAERFSAVADQSNDASLERVSKSGRNTVTRADAATQAEFRKVLAPVTANWRKAKTRNDYVYRAAVAEIERIRAAK